MKNEILVRVLVWMSWGVDSAIAAYLLQQQGYDVVAGFMKNYISDNGNCTTYTDAEEAIKVSRFLWIEIISFDLQKEYNEKIIEYILYEKIKIIDNFITSKYYYWIKIDILIL